MASKLTTVIINQSKNGLIMKVGNHHHFARLSSVKFGGEFKMQVDLNWTYQEFLLEDTTDATKKVIVNSDDCCDYERITVTEVDGKLDVVRVPRHQVSTNVTTHAVAVVDKAFRPLNIINSLLANSSWKIWLWRIGSCIYRVSSDTNDLLRCSRDDGQWSDDGAVHVPAGAFNPTLVKTK